MRETTCQNWREFKERMERYATLPLSQRQQYVFRGQADAKWKLQSTLDRRFKHLDVPARARLGEQLLREFAQEVEGLAGTVGSMPKENVELIARHHGLPTGVLDWSDSPFVASYFAYDEPAARSSEFVAVYVFDTGTLASTSLASTDLIRHAGRLTENPRAAQQRGLFVRLPCGYVGEQVLGAGLSRYLVPAADRRQALNELDEMTITRRNLFRDRDAAAATVLLRHELAE